VVWLNAKDLTDDWIPDTCWNTFVLAGYLGFSTDKGITKQPIGDRDSALISYLQLIRAEEKMFAGLGIMFANRYK
jgi:hypothetical protein